MRSASWTRRGQPPMTTLSQGVHIVLDRSFQPGDKAIMVPHTDDGRVLFVIPWHGTVLVGTTDTPVPQAELEPRALPEEIDFILRNAARYLEKDPSAGGRAQRLRGSAARSCATARAADTKQISREHVVLVSNSGLVTLIGGKWTTYRKMAEDALTDAIQVGGSASGALPDRSAPPARLDGSRRSGDAGGRPCSASTGRTPPPCATSRRRTRTGRRRSIRACPTAACTSSGRRATSWRGTSRTCSRGARAACCSTPRHRSRPRPAWSRDCSPRRWAGTRHWIEAQVAGLRRALARGYLLAD